MNDETTNPFPLRMTAYPAGKGPYERWEVTVEATGEIVISGDMPVDQAVVRKACADWHERNRKSE